MPDKHTVALPAAQETLLIPLYARALETRKRRPLLRDPRSVAMVERIDYDFARLGTGRSMIGAVLRGMIVDAWVSGFLAANPSGTVVEIGAGLNTRHERLDNGRAHWVEYDLPEVIDLRKRFFADTERRTMLAASATGEEWVPAVKTRPGPYLFVSEAVLIYASRTGAAEAVGHIRRHFPGAGLIMDTFTTTAVSMMDSHDTLRHMRARPAWSVDDPASELARWGLSVERTCTLPRATPEVRRALPLGMRLTTALIDRTPPGRRYHLHNTRVTPCPPR
ncbi:class I SAM-dependent methyltransferase [Actinokineospora fastidiosa]|uniref:Tetracenomycin C synthesis protein n=1 Tax=Actinokineospora fastidiosa TaxID=1816 RepID=A0A918LC04_9PSEU|nr:class I SAM-dependent methyltransferase [Actinokineospora fastidiosa]GGS29450.1 tetracenomycin C synthesis protein [Actinokineospora fastidiosa]